MGHILRVLRRLMSYAEFLEWAEVFRREPFDDRRCFDEPAARQLAQIANVYRDEKKRAEPFTWLDFAPYHERPSEDEQLDEKLLKFL